MTRPSAAALVALAAFATLEPLSASTGDDAVRESEIAATVAFLASPELEGRGAAERGGAVASAYVASRLQALGWLPAGDVGESPARSWFQSVGAVQATFDPAGSRVVLVSPASPSPARAAQGFRFVADRGERIELEAGLVFAGFGIRAPEYARDDYAGIDPRGKAVVVLSGEPGELDARSPWNGTRPTRHLPVSSKRSLAASLGASVLLVAPNPGGRAKSADDLLRASSPAAGPAWIGLAGAKPSIPVVYVDAEAAERWMGGFDLRAAAAALEAGRGASREFPGRVLSLRLATRDRKEVVLRNVVARLGAGSGLEGEAVLLGAHWDHLGAAGGEVHPGADDNASGIAGLLAVAAALRAEPPRGAREVVVAAWTGEERGQLGSTFFTEHPLVPLERIAAAVNLDMLGRNNLGRDDYGDVLQVIYSAGAPLLREIARRANEGVGFDLRFHGSLSFRPVSDHAALFAAGLPIVYPFSGYHDDYHRTTDTPDKVSPARIARAARYVARLVRLLAEHDGPIRLDPAIHEAPPPDPFATPYGN